MFKIKIDTGSGFTYFNPIIDGLEFVKEADDIQELIIRKQLKGDIIFYGSEYDTLKTLLSAGTYYVNLNLYFKDDLIFEGKLNLLGTINTDKKKFICEITSGDNYALILDSSTNNVEKEYNLIDVTPITTVICKTVNSLSLLEFSQSQFTDGVEGSVFFDLATIPANYTYAREKVTFSEGTSNVLIGRAGWKLLLDNGDGTITIARDWVNGGYISLNLTNYRNYGIIKTKFTPYDSYSLNEIYTSNEGDYVCYAIKIFPLIPPDFQANYYFLNINKYYKNFENSYSRCRPLKDTIEYLVNEIDSSIIIDSITWDDFFDAPGNEEMKYLHIAAMRDITGENDFRLNEILEKLSTLNPEDDKSEIESLNDEKNRLLPATDVKIKLSQISQQLYNQLNVLWYIDSNKKLRFIHAADNAYSNSGIDLRNIQNFNWMRNKNEYTYDSEKVSLIQRNSNSIFEDFVGKDISFPQLTKFVKKEITIDFYTDIWGLQLTGQDVTSGFFIFSTNKANDYNLVNSFKNGLQGYDDVNGEAWNTDEEIIGTTLTDLVSTSGAYCFSNTFTANVGDEITVSMSFSGDSTNYILWLATFDGNSFTNVVTILDEKIITTSGNINYSVNSTKYYSNLRLMIYNGNNSSTVTISNIAINNSNYYICREATGKLSGDKIPNAELSLSNTDEKYIANATEGSGTVNGVTKIGMHKKRDKSISTAIKIPYQDMDLKKYVNSNVGELIIKSQKLKLNNSFSELELQIKE